jgi:hypothetical protein
MADGEIRGRRIVLKKGMVMINGRGFRHPYLAGHIGEVVEIAAPERGSGRCLVQVGGQQLLAWPIPDFTKER